MSTITSHLNDIQAWDALSDEALANFEQEVIEKEPKRAFLVSRELMADLAHSRWSGWMEYLFSKSVSNGDGTVTIPASLVKRWQRQVETEYVDLSEREKESGRKEADEILEIVRARLTEEWW